MGLFAKLGAALMTGWHAARLTMANWGLDAARWDDSWGYTYWPTLDTRQEVDEMDRQTIWRRARLLEKNCPPIKKAVKNMVHFTGGLMPLPATADEEWNEEALRVFKARAKAPALFDVAGRINYTQAMSFLERAAVVDGDVFIVPTYAEDGGAAFAFYRAPSICGGGEQGVDCDTLNRAVTYYITDAEGRTHTLPAWQVWQYTHEKDPTSLRGDSELMPAIRHARDIQQIVGYNKAAVKLAASMGLIMTKSLDDKHPRIGSAIGGAAKKNLTGTDDEPRTLMGTGLQITAIPEGRDIKPIADTRPSTQVMQFVDFLVSNIAWASGIDAEVLFYSQKLGSGGVRFSLEKLHKWQEERLADKEVLCNSIYCHIIACEMTAGRLRPCKDANWRNVLWVPTRDMTIDTARVATAQINLSREGMADADDFTLRTTGRTVKQLARNKAANLAYMKRLCKEYGLTMAELMQGMVGTVPAENADTETTTHPDADPETT